MATHIIKQDRKDGEKLLRHEIVTWCGHRLSMLEASFTEPHHGVHCAESNSIWGYPCCTRCLKTFNKNIDKEVVY